MVYDGILMSRVINQINNTLIGGRVNRIYQISAYELLMTIRANRQNYKLLLSCHPMYARLQLSDLDFVSPQSPSHMTMLFRKHLEGGYLTKIEQVGLDRIARLDFSAFNELGDKVNFFMYVEIMGRHSNITLTDESNKIVDCLKRISPSMNTTRILQPGANYQLPPLQDKMDPFEADLVPGNNLTKTYSGFSPELSREILYRLDRGESFRAIMENIADSTNIYLCKDENGKEYFHVLPLTTVAPECKAYTLSGGLDEYFGFIDQKERIKQQTANLEKFVANEYQKNETKLSKLEQELENSYNSDEFRIIGDLIYSNLHLIKKGMTQVVLDNYYDDTKITVTLDERLDGKGNGQKYYSRYQKAKNAKDHLLEQIELTKNEIDYFDSVRTLLSNANYVDALEIKEELESLGYLKVRNRQKSKKSKRPQFTTHFTKDGIEINIGKNNLQNDYLTFKYASRFDHWFHVKDIPGSHIIVHSDNPDEYTIRLAANLAAYYSKARNSSSVPVNYTLVKSLKKPGGSKPGQVILSTYKTIYIDPDEQQVKEFENGKD